MFNHRDLESTSCRDLVVDGKCERWMQLQGKNPNTGEDVNRSNCIDDWGPLLMVENSQMQRQTGAALESFRKAAELREDFPEAHNNYGAMLNEVNDCEGATRELELAVKDLFGSLPILEARAQLGRLFLKGYTQTAIGQAGFFLARAVGLRRTLSRMTRNSRNGNNTMKN